MKIRGAGGNNERRVCIDVLEPRRMLTSQGLDTPNLAGATTSLSSDGVLYTHDTSSTAALDGLNQLDLLTGKVTHFLPATNAVFDRFRFAAVGRQFVNFEGSAGFGWLDAATQKGFVVSRDERIVSSFLPFDAGRGYFVTANDMDHSFANRVWMTDGTKPGSHALAGPEGPHEFFPLCVAGGRAYFRGRELGDNQTTAIYSVAPGETSVRLDLEVAKQFGDATFADARRLGDGLIVHVILRGAKERSNFCTIDSAGHVRTLGLDKNFQAVSILGGVDDDVVLNAPPDLLLSAQTKQFGYQLYSLNGKTRALRRLSNLPSGTIDPAKGLSLPRVFAVGATRGTSVTDDRFLVSFSQYRYDAESDDESGFGAQPQKHSWTYLVDVGDGSFRRVMDMRTTAVQSTSQGIFALGRDHSVWRIGRDARGSVPVAADIDSLAVAGDRLLMRRGDAFRTLRDTNAIVYGQAFEDIDGDGSQDLLEHTLLPSGAFVDLNRDGKLNKREPAAVYGEDGRFFYVDGLRLGSYRIGMHKIGYAAAKGARRSIDVRIGPGLAAAPATFALQARSASISIRVFNDRDGDARRDANEALINAEAFIDDDRDHHADGDLATDVHGNEYGVIYGISSGAHRLRIRRTHSDGTTQTLLRTLTLHPGNNWYEIGM